MEFTVNFKIDPLVIKIDVNPQFTQSICYLATAFGYPAQTIANELKETAKEIKAKAEETKHQEQPKQEVKATVDNKSTVEKWTVSSITPILLDYQKKGVTNKDIIRELRKYKNKIGNPIQGITELCDEKNKEDIDNFLKAVKELCKEDS